MKISISNIPSKETIEEVLVIRFSEDQKPQLLSRLNKLGWKDILGFQLGSTTYIPGSSEKKLVILWNNLKHVDFDDDKGKQKWLDHDIYELEISDIPIVSAKNNDGQTKCVFCGGPIKRVSGFMISSFYDVCSICGR